MRLRIWTFWVLLLAWCALPVSAAHGQERPDADLIIPQRHWVHPGAVEVKGVEVDVEVVDQVATTRMAIIVHNPTDMPREAQLILPVPREAAIRSFGVDAISEEPNAILMPKDEASRIYRDIVRRLADPGLLEFVGTGLIRSSVFPVPAGGTQTFRVVYEQVLEAESGRIDYVLPRSEWLASSAVDWTISLRIRSSRAIGAVYSPTHALDESRVNAQEIRIRVLDASSGGSFRLSCVAADRDGAAMTTIMYPDPRVANGKGGYFMVLLAAPDKPDGPVMKREVTLVLDRSGSMRGKKIEQAKAAALQIIEALEEGERFNVIDYSDTIASLAPMALEKNEQTVAMARAYIEQIKAVGGTNIHDALLTAVRARPSEGSLPIVLFLTDGLPTVGPTSETEIRQAVRASNAFARRIFAFGVGFDVNAPLLTALSQQSRGVPTFVEPDEDVEVKVGRVFEKLAGPVLALPELRAVSMELTVGPPAIRELIPEALPDLFTGEQMIVLGQYVTDERVTIAISGTCGEQRRSFSASLDPGSADRANAFVARLWAQRKIAALIDQIRQAGADGQMTQDDPKYRELVDSVVALSQEYGILTEYTAFIAIEEAYKQNLASDGQMQYRLGFNAVQNRSGQAGVRAEFINQARQRDARIDARADEQALQLFSITASGGGPTTGLPAGHAGGAAPRIVQEDFEPGQVAASVRHVAGRTFYRRGDRWVEAGLLEQADAEPDRTLAFGSEAYDRVVDRLIERNLQAVLGLNVTSDVYLAVDGQRVLLKRPRE